MLKMQVAAVWWFDAAGPMNHEQFTFEDLESLGPIEMVDVGILLYKDKEKVTLGGEMSQEGQFRRVITIPMVNVKRIKKWGLP
jgi:hypothetical protein